MHFKDFFSDYWNKMVLTYFKLLKKYWKEMIVMVSAMATAQVFISELLYKYRRSKRRNYNELFYL